MVPYRSNGSARAMMARTLRRPLSGLGSLGCGCRLSGAGGPTPAPGPGSLEFVSPGALPYVPYEAAKRMRLGALGIASGGPPVGAGAGAGAAIGAAQGASYGSFAGPIGTAVGAIIGAVGGAIAGSINKKDPEEYNFEQAVALWQRDPNSIYSLGNKYLVLAGLFDLNLDHTCSSRWCIPMYVKYGRLGEQRFVTDMVNVINTAAQQGRISPTDTPLTIMSRIVKPWMDSWGVGTNMIDPHSDLINKVLVGMILDYVSGQEHNWTARGGDYPFGSLPPFTLPPPVAVSPPAPLVPPAPVYSSQNPLPIVSLPAPRSVLPVSPSSQATAVTTPSPQCVAPLLWNGTQCVLQTTPQAAAPASVGAPAPPAGAVPSGFNQVATDAAGNPVFANAQGVLYQWNGAAMQQFTGQLGTNSSQAAQLQSAIQSALAQGYSAAQAAQSALAQQQAAGTPVPPAYQAQAASQAATTAQAPTVTTAGVGGALGGLGGMLAVGATVLGLLFATARPAPKRQKAAAHA